MKSTFLSVLLLSAFLTGCGGHNYEGTWQASLDSSLAKKGGMDRFASMMGTNAPLVIGDDYIEQNGQRTEVEIIERTSAGKQYLVMKLNSGEEDVFTIVDKDTLYQGNNLMSVTYTRTDN